MAPGTRGCSGQNECPAGSPRSSACQSDLQSRPVWPADLWGPPVLSGGLSLDHTSRHRTSEVGRGGSLGPAAALALGVRRSDTPHGLGYGAPGEPGASSVPQSPSVGAVTALLILSYGPWPDWKSCDSAERFPLAPGPGTWPGTRCRAEL